MPGKRRPVPLAARRDNQGIPVPCPVDDTLGPPRRQIGQRPGVPPERHLHRRLDRAQVEFIVPARPIQRGQVFFGHLLRIKQCGHYHDYLRAEPPLGYANPRFTNRDEFGQRSISSPIQGTNARGLLPTDELVVLPQASSAPNVGSAVGLIQPTDQFDAPLRLSQFQQSTCNRTTCHSSMWPMGLSSH